MTHAQSKEVSGLVHGLQEPGTPHISPKRLSQALGVDMAKLARLTGVHTDTLRDPSSKRPQARMRDVVTALSAATKHTGAGEKAIPGTSEPIADYGHRTAAELVAEGRIDTVPAFLRDLANGAKG